MRTCEVEGCEGKHEAKGLCRKHYRADPKIKRQEKEYQAKHYAKNRQRYKERRAKYYTENKQRIKAYYADPKNKQRIKDYYSKYYADPENKQRLKAWSAKWYAENYVRTGGAGHQPDAPNYVYIVANDELGAAKVGIGTRGRVAAHTSKGWEVVYLSPLMTKQDALKLERAIIGRHGVGGVVPGRYLTKEELSNGHTETFDLRELDAVLGIMPILCGESDRIDQEEKAG